MKHKKLNNNVEHYLLYLEKGDTVNASIEEFCKQHGILSAFYTGIGAITNIDLAYYNMDTKSYVRKMFEEDYELISLTGNFGYINNNNELDKWFAHTHISFSDTKYECIGGHLFEAEVLAVGEIYLVAYKDELIRNHDEVTGLNTIDLSACGVPSIETCECGGNCTCGENCACDEHCACGGNCACGESEKDHEGECCGGHKGKDGTQGCCASGKQD